jgi:hypothetical protein
MSKYISKSTRVKLFLRFCREFSIESQHLPYNGTLYDLPDGLTPLDNWTVGDELTYLVGDNAI